MPFIMSDYSRAIKIIKTFEGFNEKAYPDPETGEGPYTLGYGTQYYPDGSPVKKGHCCTKQKAMEYLLKEVNVIGKEIQSLNLGLDSSMLEALISFVHSIGWHPFLYSNIIDICEKENWINAGEEMTRWIFDNQHQVIGNLIERRREEVALFFAELNANAWTSGEILLKAFRNYSAFPNEVRAIRTLETQINPYVLAEFANNFCMTQNPENNLLYTS